MLQVARYLFFLGKERVEPLRGVSSLLLTILKNDMSFDELKKDAQLYKYVPPMWWTKERSPEG